jgi:hypothetical protein
MGTVSHPCTVLAAVPFLAAALFSFAAVHADEAVLRNGWRVQGELNADGQGRLLFQPLGPNPPLLPEQIDHIRFPSSRVLPLRAGAVYRVLLHDGQHLTGEVLGLGADKLELHTAWRERISIPRTDLAAVTHAPGFVTVFADDFENDLKSWRLTGTPALPTKQHRSGRHSLGLNTPGQEAQYTLTKPLTNGRAGINFHNPPQTAGLAWQIEAEFADSIGWPTVRVTFDPRTGDYTAEVSGMAKGHLPQQDGWQRLELEFSLDMLVISIDDAVLLSYRRPGAGGTLHKVRLTCTGVPSGTRGTSEVFFDHFAVAQTVPELPHPKGDPEQDEVWLLSGDQLFGTVAEATASRVRLRGSFGSRTVRWSELRGIYFRPSSLLVRKPDHMGVRVWLRPGSGFEPDVLDGTVRRLDKDYLVLGHDVLGELQIDRKRLHRMRFQVQ